jgi:hypothetical protein
MLGAQQGSGAQMALRGGAPAADRSGDKTYDPAGAMVNFMAGCGMMKAALPHHLY